MEEIKFNEVELTRIKLEPEEILAVKIFSDSGDQAYLDNFKESLQGFFPNNKVLIFLFPTGSNMALEAIKPAEPVMDCSTTSYCSDCSCGKKEASLVFKNPENFGNDDFV